MPGVLTPRYKREVAPDFNEMLPTGLT